MFHNRKNVAVDHLGNSLEAIICRAQDRFRPPHERWKWAYKRPWIMVGNRQVWTLAAGLFIAALIAASTH